MVVCLSIDMRINMRISIRICSRPASPRYRALAGPAC